MQSKKGMGTGYLIYTRWPYFFTRPMDTFKYAYVVLLHLVKCICILPEKQALSVKWNRFFNGSGRQGANIPLDLKKEQQNRVLKSMWRALGPNLDEANADRVAGTLEAVESIFDSIDQDCCNEDNKSVRPSTEDHEAVAQIAKDLLDQQVFQRISGREGHPSFQSFKEAFYIPLIIEIFISG